MGYTYYIAPDGKLYKETIVKLFFFVRDEVIGIRGEQLPITKATVLDFMIHKNFK